MVHLFQFFTVRLILILVLGNFQLFFHLCYRRLYNDPVISFSVKKMCSLNIIITYLNYLIKSSVDSPIMRYLIVPLVRFGNLLGVFGLVMNIESGSTGQTRQSMPSC